MSLQSARAKGDVPTRRLLSERDIEDFRRDGYLVVRQLYDRGEMQRIAAWTDEVAAYPPIAGKYMMYYEDSLVQPDKRILARIENFYPYHAEFAELLDGDGMLGRVAEFFGERAVLFKDKINFKLPGGNGFTPHQDAQAGWNDYASLHITVLLSIDPSTIENGCLELVAGRHQRGLIGSLWKPLQGEELEDMAFVPCPTEPGDVVFFDSYCPHRSGPNLTDQARRVLYITYSRLAEGDHRARYYADKRRNYPPDCERELGKEYVFRV
ncbi:MAG: phytanoyl-CoA dioxygenase family protein [Burkholderiales bacterium]